MTNRPLVAQVRTMVTIVAMSMVALVAWPASVSAHTEFVASVPEDGAVLEAPVATVTLEFTNPAVESGAGFEVLGSDGAIREPTSLDPTDGTMFIATFEPPLDVGVYGIRWEVRAGDAHPIQGSFRFTVAGSPDTSVAPDPTVPLGTTAPGGSGVPPTTLPASGVLGRSSSTTIAPTIVESDGSTVSPSLDEFLAADDQPSALVGRLGRAMSMAGTIFAVGVVAALVGFVRGRRDELRALIGWVRMAGLVVIAGGVIELAALDEAQSSALGDLIGTKPGVAAILKIVAGLLILLGFGERSGRLAAPPRSLSAAVAVDTPPDAHPGARSADTPGGDLRWMPDVTAVFGLTGVALVLASYWFDGHTVSRGPWAVHAFVNLVHVGAAAVWVGGVFAMALLAGLRRRRTEHTGLAAMVVRFSSIAAVSLGSLAVAGLVMTWLVIDGPSDLVSSDWGRLLIAKVVVVAVAAGIGAYNHFALRPALEQRPDDPSLARHLRVSLAVESAAFVVVIVLTAVLVGAAT